MVYPLCFFPRGLCPLGLSPVGYTPWFNPVISVVYPPWVIVFPRCYPCSRPLRALPVLSPSQPGEVLAEPSVPDSAWPAPGAAAGDGAGQVYQRWGCSFQSIAPFSAFLVSEG